MREEIYVALVMLIISLGGSIATKNDKKWSVFFLFLAAVAGSLTAGMGIRFREIVEGPFGFLDSLLCVFSASLLVACLNKSGAFALLFKKITAIKCSVLKAFAVLFFVALPSMLTGFAGASILTTGALVGKAIEDKKQASVVVIVGSFLGVILPPNCIPAIIATNGAGSVLPTPYVGFFLPLLLIALPAFVFFALYQRKTLAAVVVSPETEPEKKDKSAFLSLLVLALVGLAVLVDGLLSSFVYIGGLTLVFFIATILVIAVCKGFGSFESTLEALSEGTMKAVVPIAIVFALGSFIEVSSMTGVRGLYSLWILPYDTRYVMLVMMAAAIIIGYFFSIPIPAFLITYAVFPIGWLANTVVVSGCSVAIALVALITRRGGITEQVYKNIGLEGKLEKKDWLKNILPVALLVLAMGVFMVLFGDNMSFLIL
jgi:hypothetical protein